MGLCLYMSPIHHMKKLKSFCFLAIICQFCKTHPKNGIQKVDKRENNIVSSRKVMQYKDVEQKRVLLLEWHDYY